MNRLTGARIATGRGFTVDDGKRTEANEADFTALFQRTTDVIKHRVNSFGCVGFGQARRISDSGDKIIFINGRCPLLQGLWI